MLDGENGLGAAEAARLLAAASADPALSARLRAAYRGTDDALDALWWRAHPLTETPAGIPDPAIEWDALRRTAYSRGGSPADLAAVYEHEQRTRRSAVLLDEAMRAITPVNAAVLSDARPAVPPAMDAMQVRAAEAGTAERVPPLSPPTKRRTPIAIAIVAAAIVLIGVGFGLGHGVASPATPDPSPSHTFGPFSAGQHGTSTLALLEEPQTPGDIPPLALADDIVASTVHLLPGIDSPAVTVYGALSKSQEICLILITSDLKTASTCATETTFVANGIRLRITTADEVVNHFGFATPAYYDYIWTSDGAIVGTSNVYQFPAPP